MDNLSNILKTKISENAQVNNRGTTLNIGHTHLAYAPLPQLLPGEQNEL